MRALMAIIFGFPVLLTFLAIGLSPLVPDNAGSVELNVKNAMAAMSIVECKKELFERGHEIMQEQLRLIVYIRDVCPQMKDTPNDAYIYDPNYFLYLWDQNEDFTSETMHRIRMKGWADYDQAVAANMEYYRAKLLY